MADLIWNWLLLQIRNVPNIPFQKQIKSCELLHVCITSIISFQNGAQEHLVCFQEQSIIGNLNIAPAVNWAGKNSKDYTRLFLEVLL